MAREQTIDQRAATWQWDVWAAVVGLVLAIFILAMSYSRFNINQEHLGFALLIACALYLLARKRLAAEVKAEFTPSRTLLLLNHLAFLLLFIASLWILQTHLYTRPPSYFIIVALLCASIVLEILWVGKGGNPWLIVGKIILVGINLQWGIYYLFPSPYGEDPWGIEPLLDKLVAYGGHIVPGLPWDANVNLATTRSSNFSYVFYYVSGLSFKSLASISSHEALFLIGVTQVISTIFVFLIGRKLLGTRAGLLAMLLVATSSYNVRWSAWVIATTLGYSFFAIVLWLVLTDDIKEQLLNRALLFFFVVVLIFTHHHTTLVALVTLVALNIGKNLRSRSLELKPALANPGGATVMNIDRFGLAFFGVFTLYHWLYNIFFQQESVLGDLLPQILRTMREYGGFGRTTELFQGAALPEVTFEAALDNLGWLIIVGMGVLGALIWLSHRKWSTIRFSILLALGALSLATYLPMLFNLGELVPGRWFVFIIFLLALPAGEAILGLASLLRNRLGMASLSMGLAAALAFFMFTSSISNRDTPVYTREMMPLRAYTASEMAASDFLRDRFGTMYSPLGGGFVAVDLGYLHPANIRLGMREMRPVPMTLERKDYQGMVVVRDYIFKRVFWRGEAMGEELSYFPVYNLGPSFKDRFHNPSYSLVYDNGPVWGYLSRDLGWIPAGPGAEAVR